MGSCSLHHINILIAAVSPVQRNIKYLCSVFFKLLLGLAVRDKMLT